MYFGRLFSCQRTLKRQNKRLRKITSGGFRPRKASRRLARAAGGSRGAPPGSTGRAPPAPRSPAARRVGAAGGPRSRSRSRPAGAGRPAALPPSGCWAWTPSSPPAPSGGGPLAEMAKRFDHSLVHSLPFGHGSRPFGSSKPGQTRSCPRRSSPPRARRAGRCSLNRRERAIGRLPCSLSAQRIHPRLHRRAGSSFKTPFCLQNTRVHLWGKAHLVEANCGAELLGLAALGSAQLWPLQNVPRGPAPRRLG